MGDMEAQYPLQQSQVQLASFNGREPLLTWAPTDPASHPVNYFVPDFGVDHDIAASQKFESEASSTLKTTWTPKWDDEKEAFADMPTFSNDFMKVQLDSEMRSEREPLLTWKATEPATHKMNYFVPAFGGDPDIENSLTHSKDLNLPAEERDEDNEKVFPYQAAKFQVDPHFKFTPVQNTYPSISEFSD